VPIGVVLHARTVGFLGARTIDDADELRARVPDVDTDVLLKYLRSWVKVAAGDVEAGPVALLPPSERFHWLTCPRSDVLQSSRVHGGVTEDPAAALEELWQEHVAGWNGAR
jgi:hypothetical protein